MLRFWITVSLLLTVVFTGIGLMVSKAWGWSEYASPELYLVSASLPDNYFITNTDGSDKPEKLVWNRGTITTIGCSPNGNTFAFLTDRVHLYVLTSNGISYDKVI